MSKQLETIKRLTSTEIPYNFTGIIEYPSGTKFYYYQGKKQRHDGPAIVYYDGIKNWYLNDVLYSEESFNIITKLTRRVKRNSP